MSLQWFLDLRFGDPVLALSLTTNGLAYGTALGRVVYFNFDTYQTNIIAEFSQECIRGIYLNQAYQLIVAIGDLHCLIVYSCNQMDYTRFLVPHCRNHNSDRCSGTRVLMNQGTVILIEKEVCFVSESKTETCIEYQTPKMTEDVVFFQNRHSEIIWVQWEGKERKLKTADLTKEEVFEYENIQGMKESITQVKFLTNYSLLVCTRRKIYFVPNLRGKVQLVGVHGADIMGVSFVVEQTDVTENSQGSFSPNQSFVIASVDYQGCVCLWNHLGLLQKIWISSLEELSFSYKSELFFDMGYPYCMQIVVPYISFSTDFAVMVIKSRYLSNL